MKHSVQEIIDYLTKKFGRELTKDELCKILTGVNGLGLIETEDEMSAADETKKILTGLREKQ